MSTFPLRLPEELKEKAAAQAAEAGVSLNQYIALAVATRVGAQAEVERYFQSRGSRATRGRAKEMLAKAGTREPRPEDMLD